MPAGAAKSPRKIVKGVVERLRFLSDVGLDYLTLDRSAETLSGGESQRIRLASQVGSGLTGVMYILDEPSIGLHQRDNRRLLGTLRQLRDLGNTVIVVEHDEEAILGSRSRGGPGSRRRRARRTARGTGHARRNQGESRLHHRAVSVAAGGASPCPRCARDRIRRATIRIVGAHGNNLRHVDVDDSAGAFHLRDRRVGLGQINTHHRHAVWTRRGASERRARRRRAG